MIYSIVTFGYYTFGQRRSYYRSVMRARADARTLGGGSLSTVRIVECPSVKEAKSADISDEYPVVWTR